MKIAVLISGRGSNLQSLIDAQNRSAADYEIMRVVANVPDAPGLDRAERAGIETRAVDHKLYAGREPFEDALMEALAGSGAELVCLAGFMRLLTDHFIARWPDRLINIHPSLLPAFKGLHTHRRALEAGARFSGCTIHFVRPAMDDGPIIAQAAVPIHPGDTVDSLAARILIEEHRMYPLAVNLIAQGRVHVDGARVRIDGHAPPDGALVNPAG
jgi:phosphoribosylglycinamide formyltransferase-1